MIVSPASSIFSQALCLDEINHRDSTAHPGREIRIRREDRALRRHRGPRNPC